MSAKIATDMIGSKTSDGRKVREVVAYDSMGEYIEAAKARGKDGMSSHATGRDYPKWTGSKDFDDAVRLATDGYMEIRSKVDGIANGLIAKVRDTVVSGIDWVPSVAGGSINMGRYMTGDPRCAMRPVPVDMAGKRPTVRIMIGQFASSNIAPETIVNRGIAVVALIDLLTKAGRATEIYSECSLADNYPKASNVCAFVVRVKASHEQADVNQIMFAMAHPSMFRRMTFAVAEGCKDDVCRMFGFPGFYGYPTNLITDEALDIDVKCQTIKSGTTWDVSQSVAWIVEQLKSCGVTIEGMDE